MSPKVCGLLKAYAGVNKPVRMNTRLDYYIYIDTYICYVAQRHS